MKMGLCPRLPRNLRGAIEPWGDARPHREPLKLQFPTYLPVEESLKFAIFHRFFAIGGYSPVVSRECER